MVLEISKLQAIHLKVNSETEKWKDMGYGEVEHRRMKDIFRTIGSTVMEKSSMNIQNTKVNFLLSPIFKTF